MTETGRNRKKQLDEWGDELDGLDYGFFTMGVALRLREVIDGVLGFPAPEGDPGYIDGKSADYTRAAAHIDQVHKDVTAVAAAGLPEVWVGEASSRASAVTRAAGNNAEGMAETFTKAGRELSLLAEGITEAQRAHRTGQDAAHAARGILGDTITPDVEQAHRAASAARDAVRQLRSAVGTAEEAGERAARELDKLMSEARAGKLDSKHLSDADRIVLADTAAPGGDREDNEILSAGDLDRAGTFLDRMSPEDRTAYDRMLDDAKSPQERAYLMKALAAGYDLEEIQDFGAKIHPYGDDPQWLQQHLTPVVTDDDDSMRPGDQSERVAFGPAEWTQGQHPTCVVSSTITAHAMVDPLYALELTSGGHPGDPEYDNPEAFADRLRAEQAELHEESGGDPDSGLSVEAGHDVANREISPHTGQEYESVDLENAGDREDALPDIRDAVNEGRPVTVGVTGEGGHRMLIIGQEGDKLQIYNPWGFTTWVSEEDFIDGDISEASDDRLPEPYNVQIPG